MNMRILQMKIMMIQKAFHQILRIVVIKQKQRVVNRQKSAQHFLNHNIDRTEIFFSLKWKPFMGYLEDQKQYIQAKQIILKDV